MLVGSNTDLCAELFRSSYLTLSDQHYGCIEETSIPVAMSSLLEPLPNTQLQRRLAAEGRMQGFGFSKTGSSENVRDMATPKQGEEFPDQATLGGLGFVTTRDRFEIFVKRRLYNRVRYIPSASG